MDGAQQAKQEARSAGRSEGARKAVLVGWAAKGVVYVALAWIVIQLALEGSSEEASTTGALQVIADAPLGRPMLVVLGIGLLLHAAGRILETTVLAAPDLGASDKAQGAVLAVVYVLLALSAFATAGLAGGSSGGGGGDQGEQGSAFLLELPAGRFLVGLVGLAIIAGGAYVAWSGVEKKFLPTLRTGEMSSTERTWTTRIGVAAYVTRGVIFALVGWFFLQSAIAYDPDEATGIDGALREVAQEPWGQAVLVAIAVGLLAYGAFSFIQARYRDVGSAASGTTS